MTTYCFRLAMCINTCTHGVIMKGHSEFYESNGSTAQQIKQEEAG